MNLIFKLSKAFYLIACLFLFVLYGYNAYSYGLGGDFAWTNAVIIASSFLGLSSLFLRPNLSRLTLIFSSLPLGLLAALEALRIMRTNGDEIDGSGEIYAASAFEIFLPLFIFLLCVTVLASCFVKKGAEPG
ncbi:hypothetical protein [Erythrobacter sp.]|uniref:hypothetical protein n=1 Tax=Erythrobacter sp. TaxID=1042 RepID=UPI001B196988|nr:hypothetical protein [Erythrobacter sp.]MBO6526428.1 hypothetical protein [Erythrobacter sp.]MBO6530301.1 hypothetical protein [Erythrobacter sp.]